MDKTKQTLNVYKLKYNAYFVKRKIMLEFKYELTTDYDMRSSNHI